MDDDVFTSAFSSGGIFNPAFDSVVEEEDGETIPKELVEANSAEDEEVIFDMANLPAPVVVDDAGLGRPILFLRPQSTSPTFPPQKVSQLNDGIFLMTSDFFFKGT